MPNLIPSLSACLSYAANPALHTYPSDDPSIYWAGWQAAVIGLDCDPPYDYHSDRYWQWLSGWIDADHEQHGGK